MESIKKLYLLCPFHLKMKESGYGEFPDSYVLTAAGENEISKLILQEQINLLNEIRGGFNNDDRFYIDYKIEQLEQQLKELEDGIQS